MSLTNEEKLELLKQHGSVCTITSEPANIYRITIGEKNLLAYTSAIEEKYQAQIAMLVNKLKSIKAIVCGDSCPNWAGIGSVTHSRGRIADICELEPDTQATSDAFIAEVKAAERKSTLDELRRRLSENDETAAWNIDDMASELRNQQEGKEPK